MRSYSLGSKLNAAPALFDKWFVGAIISIVVIGLVMMASASIVISDKQLHQPFYFLSKQIMFLALGVMLGTLVVQHEVQIWQKWGGYVLLGTLLLLALVLVPRLGHRVNGSTRWIGHGPFTFQVSELAKFVTVIYMAGYLVRRNDEIRSRLSGFVKPLMVLGAIALLLLREPDFGATVVVTGTALGMMFLAGMRLRHFAVFMLMALVGLGTLAVSEPYRWARLTSFWDPWARPFDSGYQLTQALIAIGRGGWWGVGLGKSIQKMSYLPEAHTDFLFAVMAEELGLCGTLAVMGLFVLLVTRMFVIGRAAQHVHDHFSGFLAYGFALWTAIQFIVSVGVNSGLLPTKGLTLPLMSYGGSSFIVNCLAIALLLRIDYETRTKALMGR